MPAVVAGFVFSQPLVHSLRLEGGWAEFAVQYLQILLPTLPAYMVLHIGTACLRGAGDTVSGLIAMILINVVNVTISWASVLHFKDQPQLQWKGIALGPRPDMSWAA